LTFTNLWRPMLNIHLNMVDMKFGVFQYHAYQTAHPFDLCVSDLIACILTVSRYLFSIVSYFWKHQQGFLTSSRPYRRPFPGSVWLHGGSLIALNSSHTLVLAFCQSWLLTVAIKENKKNFFLIILVLGKWNEKKRSIKSMED